MQNIIIVFLIIWYAPRISNKTQTLAMTTVATAVSLAALSAVPPSSLSLLQMGTLPLSVFSKLPQIRQNARAESTGQLSSFAVVAQIAGCLARLFTTATEVDDWIVSAGIAVALILNIVLGIQMYIYWPKVDKTAYEMQSINGRKAESAYPEKVSAVYEPTSTTTRSQPTQPLQHRVSTPPPPRAQTPSSGGKKWTRKVD